MKETVTFRLINGKKLGSYSFKGGISEKNGVQKSINYYPGSDSIFDEDNRKTAIKPQIVVFKCNNNVSDLAVEIVVDKSNKTLIDYLKARKEFGRIYDIHDKEGMSLKKIENYDSIQRALELVSESDDFKTEAIGLAVLGFEHFGRPIVMVKADLKEKAINDPESIIAAFEDPSYESKFIAALAFSKKVIKSDITRTSILWGDSEGKIINVAPGESPIEKLSKFIQLNSSESETLLQEIGLRLGVNYKADNSPTSSSEVDLEKEAMRKKIEELESALASTQKIDESPQQGDYENSKNESLEDDLFMTFDLESEGESLDSQKNLESAQEQYFNKFDKEVPNNMKNNLGWILSKLSESV